jgi:predicted PurR-regulated permease PerM
MSETRQPAQDRMHDDPGNRRLREVTDLVIRLGALALLIGWCGVILLPFLMPIAWGVIIAIAIYRPYSRLSVRLGNRHALAATLVVLAMFAAIIVPAVLLGNSLVGEVQSLFAAYQEGRLAVPEPSDKVATWPLVGKQVHAFWQLASHNIDAALAKLQPYLKDLFSWLLGAAAQFGMALLEYTFALVISGVLLTTAARSSAGAMALAVRLGGERGRELFELAIATIRGVTTGILGVALAQAVLAGLALLVAGVPAAGVLTFVMLVTGVLQMGVGLVMIPTAVWLFANAEPATAAAFTAWTVLLLPIDNVLKPLLMGRGLDVPVVVIFLGAIGGFIVQGIIGLFVGAVALVLGYELLKQWLQDGATRPPPAPEPPPA